MEEIKNKEIQDLILNSKVAFVGSVDENGTPNIKAMLYLEPKVSKYQYFSTNFSARRTQQFIKNPKACIYFCNEGNYQGVIFTGNIEVCTDLENKTRLWREGFEMYYPKGIEDDDYCVFKFTGEVGNYYHGLENFAFDISELE